MDREEANERERRYLLRAAPLVRGDRRFYAQLVEPKRIPVKVEPDLFMQVLESAVRPIILAAEHCRLSVCAEQLPDVDRAASEPTESIQRSIARDVLARWGEAGATPAAWMKAFATRVKDPVNDHLCDDTVYTALSCDFHFTTKPQDVEIDLSSDVVNTPLFWWWLFCGGLNIESVFMMDTTIVSAPAFWTQILRPEGISTRLYFAERFARRQTVRSTRVAMMIGPSLSLKVVAAAQVIEPLYRMAVQSAVVRNERYESWLSENQAPETEGSSKEGEA